MFLRCCLLFVVLVGSLQTLICSRVYANDQEAIQNTIDLLNNPKAREEVVARDPEAQKAHDYAKKVGGDQVDGMYSIASRVFSKLMVKYNNDVEKINEVLRRATTDPEGFAKEEFSVEELAALKEFAGRLPASTGGAR
jgi:hypothetical protein